MGVCHKCDGASSARIGRKKLQIARWLDDCQYSLEG